MLLRRTRTFLSATGYTTVFFISRYVFFVFFFSNRFYFYRQRRRHVGRVVTGYDDDPVHLVRDLSVRGRRRFSRLPSEIRFREQSNTRRIRSVVRQQQQQQQQYCDTKVSVAMDAICSGRAKNLYDANATRFFFLVHILGLIVEQNIHRAYQKFILY